jgi:DNA-binding NtrC family response regulator
MTEARIRGGSVLVVDDEPEILATLGMILEARGFRVKTAQDATTAIRLLDGLISEGLDVVVTDILLPGPSGVDLLAAIRDRSTDVEVVLMSGAPSLETASAAMRLGASDYLTKPISGTQLVELLRKAVGRRDARRVERDEHAAVAAELGQLREAVEARSTDLRQSHERYRQLVDSLDVVVFEMDLRTRRLTHVGGGLARRLLGDHLSELEEFPEYAVHVDDRALVRETTAAWARDGAVLSEPPEVRFVTPAGEQVWVRCIPSGTHHQGPVLLLSGVLVDVTALRTVEERRAALEIELVSARQQLDRRLLQNLEPITTTPRVQSQAQSAEMGIAEFGTSAAMARARSAATLAAEHEEPVLITGETGTGKGVIAEFVHRHSLRAKGPFVSLNCASLRGDLLSTELFGHTKGAFTSADRQRKGLIEEAEGGTLFLDEMGEMGLEVQGQLLKVLEEKTYRRVGESSQRRSDFRLLCATHRDLHRMADAGAFRHDLIYRIDVFRVAVPPLRERREDIIPLSRWLLARAGAHEVKLSAEAMKFLEDLPWNGNVRELRSALIRASLLARGQTLRPEHFEDFLARDSEPISPATFAAVASTRPSRPAQTAGAPSKLEPLDDSEDTDEERVRIAAMLTRFDGNRAKVARELGVARSTLYRKLDRFGL